MFEIDNERTSLSISPDRILALVTSLNAPNVVGADFPVEPTRAYICVYREGADRIAFSIYLHFVGSHKGAFYRHEERVVPRDRYDEVMAEALAFSESLGFMMDDQGFRDLPPARQRELMAQAPLFYEPKPPAPPVAAGGGVADPGDLLAPPSAGVAGTAAARPAPAPPRPVPAPPVQRPQVRAEEPAEPPAGALAGASELPRAAPPAPRASRAAPAAPAAGYDAGAAEPAGGTWPASVGLSAGLPAGEGEGRARETAERGTRGVQRAAAPISPAAVKVLIRLLASL